MPEAPKPPLEENLTGFPPGWDLDTLIRNWVEILGKFLDEGEVAIPLKRLRAQVEKSSEYLEITIGWKTMDEPRRLAAWKRLIQATERAGRELLPACVRCGECCRKGSPTLQAEDAELLKQGKIPWSALVTLRKGEPVRSAHHTDLVFLHEERVKVRETNGTRACLFFEEETEGCAIYADRPVQCRAQACWDPAPARQLMDQPFLTRPELLKGVELLLEIIAEHDARCGFPKLHEAFKRLEETRGETVNEVLELLSYEHHYRNFFREKFNIPEDTLDLIFGRSFVALAPLFGFRVEEDADGVRTLFPDA